MRNKLLVVLLLVISLACNVYGSEYEFADDVVRILNNNSSIRPSAYVGAAISVRGEENVLLLVASKKLAERLKAYDPKYLTAFYSHQAEETIYPLVDELLKKHKVKETIHSIEVMDSDGNTLTFIFRLRS